MNNGKVRIYELSRELNLENKDILAACERLNIAVKSHSSTITDDDAGRIRSELQNASKTAVAPKPAPTEPKKPSPPRPRTAPKKPGAKSGGANKPVRKQQILEIRRHRPKPPVKPTEAPSADSKSAATPSVAPSSSRSELETPNRPARNAPPQINRPRTPSSERPPIQSPSRPQASSPSPRPTPAAEADEVSPPNVELVQPPSRPTKPARPVKPLLKRDRSRTRGDGDSQSSGPIPIREVDEENLQLKPKPELRRPNKGRAPEVDDSDAGDEGATPSLTTPPDPETSLRRPTPPRQRKKGRGSSTRDEDEQQELRKPKTANKGKRRSYNLLEEDDPLDEVGKNMGEGGDSTPSNLSMSLARPPKPKSARGSSPKPPQHGSVP
jgi:translation initiation factor IF-2